MILKGIVRGKTIELEEALPYEDGEILRIEVQPLSAELEPGSPAAILRAMCEPPHVSSEDVDALLEAIKSGTLPISEGNLFEEKP